MFRGKKKLGILVSIGIICVLMLCVISIIDKNQNKKSLLIVGDSIGEGTGCSTPELKWYKKLIPYMKEK